MDEHKAEKENVALRSESHRTAGETRTFLNVVLQEHLVSGADLIPRTASVLPEGGKYRVHLFGQSTARFQLNQVFKLVESFIPKEAAVFLGYL